MASIKVMTWNVEFLYNFSSYNGNNPAAGNPTNSFDYVAAVLNHVKPDVICFQEVAYNKSANAINIIKGKLTYGAWQGEASGSLLGNSCLVVLYNTNKVTAGDAPVLKAPYSTDVSAVDQGKCNQTKTTMDQLASLTVDGEWIWNDKFPVPKGKNKHKFDHDRTKWKLSDATTTTMTFTGSSHLLRPPYYLRLKANGKNFGLLSLHLKAMQTGSWNTDQKEYEVNDLSKLPAYSTLRISATDFDTNELPKTPTALQFLNDQESTLVLGDFNTNLPIADPEDFRRRWLAKWLPEIALASLEIAAGPGRLSILKHDFKKDIVDPLVAGTIQIGALATSSTYRFRSVDDIVFTTAVGGSGNITNPQVIDLLGLYKTAYKELWSAATTVPTELFTKIDAITGAAAPTPNPSPPTDPKIITLYNRTSTTVTKPAGTPKAPAFDDTFYQYAMIQGWLKLMTKITDHYPVVVNFTP